MNMHTHSTEFEHLVKYINSGAGLLHGDLSTKSPNAHSSSVDLPVKHNTSTNGAGLLHASGLGLSSQSPEAHSSHVQHTSNSGSGMLHRDSLGLRTPATSRNNHSSTPGTRESSLFFPGSLTGSQGSLRPEDFDRDIQSIFLTPSARSARTPASRKQSYRHTDTLSYDKHDLFSGQDFLQASATPDLHSRGDAALSYDKHSDLFFGEDALRASATPGSRFLKSPGYRSALTYSSKETENLYAHARDDSDSFQSDDGDLGAAVPGTSPTALSVEEYVYEDEMMDYMRGRKSDNDDDDDDDDGRLDQALAMDGL